MPSKLKLACLGKASKRNNNECITLNWIEIIEWLISWGCKLVSLRSSLRQGTIICEIGKKLNSSNIQQGRFLYLQ